MKPEPSTLKAAGGYSCHTDNKGPAPRRALKRFPIMRGIYEEGTAWEEIDCGHITSDIDSGCDGCEHQK